MIDGSMLDMANEWSSNGELNVGYWIKFSPAKYDSPRGTCCREWLKTNDYATVGNGPSIVNCQPTILTVALEGLTQGL